jgi:hypothetical protein
VLLTNNYSPTDVVTIKTTYGEEIISRISEETITGYVLTKPMCLISTPQGGSGLAPAVFSVKSGDSVTLNKSAVALMGRTESDMASQYIAHTTGIKMPGNNLI